jgi:putative ABC transport system substrate-binding protein
LRELGYVDGQNLTLDFLNPDAHAGGITGAMKELVHRKVDVIIAPYESAVKAALDATDTVPIVMIAIDYDPLALGYTKSLARPSRSNDVLGYAIGGPMERNTCRRSDARISACRRRVG